MIPSKIVVTGAGGQLGRELQASAASYPEFTFIFLSREDLPIQNNDAVRSFFEVTKPQYCINCAAYTAVDKAETETEMAFLVNGEAAGMLALNCKLFNTRFIHISTDYVFNGTATRPYTEEEEVEPVNTYGASKLRGEELSAKLNPQSIIIRTSWIYSIFGNNFVKTMMRLMRERASVNVVMDQQGSPTYASDLAEALIEIIKSDKWIPGIYNYSNEGIITWYDFAKAIKELTGSSCDIIPIPTSSFPTDARRPGFSVLDKRKIRSVYNIATPDWEESLSKCIKRLIS